MTMASLLARSVLLFAAGGVLRLLGSRGASDGVRHERAAKYWGYLVIVNGVLLVSDAGTTALTVRAALIVIVGTFEFGRAWRRMAAPRPWWPVFLAAAAAAGFIIAAARAPAARVAWLYLVCASFDGIAQVIGQLIGRRPLAPRISPAKTVEGMLGGFVGSALVAQWLRDVPGYDARRAFVTAAVIGVTALVGDLCGSWMKRRAGIKDFSTLLPGQGGVVDRFNSFVLSLALVGPWL